MTLQTSILKALSNVHPMYLPETTLQIDAGLQLGRSITRADLTRELGVLEAKHQVTGITGEENARKWWITDNGLARLASN